jgi:hypothetical protein
MIEITGFDHTNNRGFKKLVFETTRDGKRTANANFADGIQKDDWVEVTMDDTQYKNIINMKKIGAPEGSNVPDSTQGQRSSGGGGGGAKKSNMSKEEWALKDAKKELSMARHKAIEALAIMSTGKGITKASMDSLEKAANRLTAYILSGDFDAEVVVPVLEKPVAQTDNTPDAGNTREPGDEQSDGAGAEGAGGAPNPEDDDIPF